MDGNNETAMTTQRRLFSSCLAVMSLLVFHGCVDMHAGGVQLRGEDLTNAERLLEYRRQATVQERRVGEELFRYAQQAERRDAATAAKAYGESVLAYPMSPALLGLAEQRAKMLSRKDDRVKHDALREVVQYLETAEKVNRVDRMLSDETVGQLERDRACTQQFLTGQKADASCRPVEWIGLR